MFIRNKNKIKLKLTFKMSSGIPQDANFKKLSCQLGGLTLNGNDSQGTANSLNVITINDPSVAQTLTKTITGKFLQLNVANQDFYIPLYQ
jgi:hypothetical protein